MSGARAAPRGHLPQVAPEPALEPGEGGANGLWFKEPPRV